MLICNTAVQKLQKDNDLDAPVKQMGICVFNYQERVLKKLSKTEEIRREIKKPCLWLSNVAPRFFHRPAPKAVEHGEFRKLDQAELEKGFSFNNLKFISKILDEKLVVTYKGNKVYEEPLYLMLYDENDEEDEEMDVGEASAFFDDRGDCIKRVLKEVYGKEAILTGDYPALVGTSDFNQFLTEYLDLESLDAFTLLQLFLKLSTTQGQYDEFFEHVSHEWNSVEDVVDILFPEYKNYCGVSAGYRTCLWDSMVSVYKFFNADLEHDVIVEMIEKRFDCDEFKSYKDYDIENTSMVESITYLWELYQEAEGKLKKALALGLLCSADVWTSS